MQNWAQLSYYVTYYGTSTSAGVSIYSYGGATTEDPWVVHSQTTTTTTTTTAAATTTTAAATTTTAAATTTHTTVSTTTAAASTTTAATTTAATTTAATTTAATTVSTTTSSTTSKSSSSTTTTAAATTSSVTPAPSGWAVASTSCIVEGTTGRALQGASTTVSSVQQCATYCNNGGFAIFGVEYGSQCFCGSYLSGGASLSAPATNCNIKCANGDICGGAYALNLYISTGVNAALLTPNLQSSVVSLPSGWSAASSPCINEASGGRALTGAFFAADSMSIATCLTYCGGKGFQYAGVEYGRECYCGNSLQNGASLTSTSTNCQMPCFGNPSQSCGGTYAVQLYQNPSLSFAAVTYNGYVKTACIQEVNGRALNGASYRDYSGMTIESCTAYCYARGYTLSGVEYGGECYCGSALANGASLSLSSGQCYMNCAGNSTENCGGPNALYVYTYPTALAVKNILPTGWSAKGCIAEAPSGRALTVDVSAQLPAGTVTGASCSQLCANQGYAMAGTEYFTQCYCGNALSNGATSTIVTATQCNTPCSGNGQEMCGGSYRLSWYSSQ